MTVGFVPRRSGAWSAPVRSGRVAGSASSAHVSGPVPDTAGGHAIPPPRTERSSVFEPRRPASPEAVALLGQAEHGLAEVDRETTAAGRFVASYLSALRAGAAILVAKGRPHRRAARPQSTWTLLTSAAPEVAQWAEYFAARSAAYAAAQAGISRHVGAEAADELRDRAGEFLSLARRVVHGSDDEPEPRTSRCGACTRPRSRRGGE
ncbi:hypothetical protein SaccyDRAFT_3670 [Saccharomonospora cyanea NA-134]|uniref:SAV-6107-like HEPN domain-containing protein n=1 Tax=Saccharomonospora cyanea NA-134 TaxID=882082 RepID=H5XEL8_9PSEU|nr:hypothetical protein SaccyDRAFT_3670 [Saccharomonospora cyanea NA-134]